MIITLICIAVSVTGVVMYATTKRFKHDNYELCSIAVMTLGFLFVIIIGIGIFVTHSCTSIHIIENEAEMKALRAEVQAVETMDTDLGNLSRIQVIQDVTEWNKNVSKKKTFLANPLFSWFVDKQVVDALEYIDLSDFGSND